MEDEIMGYPIKTVYRYLGIMIDQSLNGREQLEQIRGRI